LREKETIQTGLTDSVQYLNLENFWFSLMLC
jgi:hypothetical protein